MSSRSSSSRMEERTFPLEWATTAVASDGAELGEIAANGVMDTMIDGKERRMTDGVELHDGRQTATGWPRVIFVLLAVGSAIFLWRGIVASTDDFLGGHGARGSLTLLSAAAWAAGAIGVVHNGRRMRRVATACWAANLCAPFAALTPFGDFLDRVSPWHDAGSTYFYLPTVGALAALAWLAWSMPAKIATRNGG